MILFFCYGKKVSDGRGRADFHTRKDDQDKYGSGSKDEDLRGVGGGAGIAEDLPGNINIAMKYGRNWYLVEELALRCYENSCYLWPLYYQAFTALVAANHSKLFSHLNESIFAQSTTVWSINPFENYGWAVV